MSREEFRRRCVERDGGQCLVPDCDSTVTEDPDGPGEVHHIVERRIWPDGGYIESNGASVCNDHHRLAESNVIPPQAFWRWIGIEEITIPGIHPHSPDTITFDVDDSGELIDINKWGEELKSPPWQEHRDYIKYPSTHHFPWSHERDSDDTAHNQLDWATGYDLVATVKMDGGNCMIVKDQEDPIRARNGRHADKDHFDMAKQWYWENNLYSKIPKHLQVFGEWLYAKHSIHYGCDCEETCEDVGPELEEYFQVFGMYDTRYNLWLGWHETMKIADRLGLMMVQSALDYDREGYEIGSWQKGRERKMWSFLYPLSQDVVDEGHEGIVVRSKYPFQYGQIDRRLGKYVRPGHVKDDEVHWSKRQLVQNRLK